MNTDEQTFPVVKVFLFTRHYSFLLHRLCSECDNLLIFSEACLLFFELSPPSVIFTRVSCWQQFVWRHHQPVVSLCVRMNSFSYSNPRLWAFTCSCMFSLLSPLPAAAPFSTLAPSKSPSVRQLQSAVFLSVRHRDTWQSPAVAVSHFELIIPSFFSDLSDYEGSRANLTSKDDRCHALPCPNLHFSKNPGVINPER